MSIQFDVSKVENYKEVTTDPENPHNWNPVTYVIVHLMCSCGVPCITKENLPMVVSRIQRYEERWGALLYGILPSGEKIQTPLTEEEITLHVGLSVNACNLSENEFLEKIKG